MRKSSFKTVEVIGLGYIGLPTAAVFASRKINVVGVDVNEFVVETINNGDVHIVEPDLDIVVKAAVTQGYLRARTVPEPADAFIIAVPTPFGDNHEPDLKFVESAARSIASVLQPGNLVVLESTSPPGTTEQLAAWLAEERQDLKFPQSFGLDADIQIAHCPERVLPGHVLTELIQNDRVIGGMTALCSERAIELYNCFVEADMLITKARTAEMCKLVENSFRDVNIAFANELSMICADLDINVWELIQLANHHPRVNILQPGTGVGGHCIAVDPWFIVSQAKESAHLIRCARNVNDRKPAFVASQIIEAAQSEGINEIVCLGLAFKPDIDDLRESPALEVVRILSAKGLTLSLVEPNITQLPEELDAYGHTLVTLEESFSIGRTSIATVLVAHQEFRDPDLPGSFHRVLDFSGVTIHDA